MIASVTTVLYVDDNTKSRRLLGSVLEGSLTLREAANFLDEERMEGER